MMRKALIVLAMLGWLLSGPTFAAFAIFQTSSVVSGTGGAFKKLPLGGGGFVTNIRTYADGTQAIRTDTNGASVRSSYTQPWTFVTTHSGLPSGDADQGMMTGACEIARAPTNTSIIYMFYAPNTGVSNFPSYIYKSTDGGVTWARTHSSFPSTNYCAPNTGQQRLANSYMDVSPADANTVYVGTINGVWYTKDGGVSWNALSTATIPASTYATSGGSPIANLIAFDPSDATGNTVIITSSGTGVYKCTAARTTPLCSFLNSAGMPTTSAHLSVSSTGTIWLTSSLNNNVQGDVYRYISSTWSKQITQVLGTNEPSCIAVNPTAAGSVYVFDYRGLTTYSLNAEAGSPTWNGPTTFSIASTLIPWMPFSAEAALSVQSCWFDPTQTNVIYGGTGIGVFSTTAPTSGTPNTVWNGNPTAGVENLVATSGFYMGGSAFLTAWDKAIWKFPTLGNYATSYGPSTTPQINKALGACGYNGVVMVLTDSGLSTSTDSGASYSGFSNPSSLSYGNCVPFDSTHWIWLGGNDVGPYFTSNGSTFSACTFSGGKTAGGGGFINNTFQYRKILAQDSVTPTTTLLYNDGTGSGNGSGAAGFWKNTSGTSCSFTQVKSGTLGSNAATSFAQLSPVPGQSCNFFFSAVAYSHGTLPDTTAQLFKTTDCGTTWSSAIASVNSPLAWAFGATKPGHTYPTFYCICWVSGVYGAWQADDIDATATWTKIGDGYPADNPDLPVFMIADPSIYGTIVGGFTGSGYWYRTLN